ncbi:MAG: TolC family protein [Woeseiaceae bacterium]|nr:TolC family protein [Woeseiaceae bacterium]
MNADSMFPLILLGLLSGCAGTASDAEQAARDRVTEVGEQLRPARNKPELPALQADSPLDTYLLYAVLNHPAVEAEYYEWRATVEDIAPARSQPDPQFTFEADFSDTLMTFMPGLMFDFMAPGKRAAMGLEAAAGSEVAYQNYVATVMITATSLRKAWIELAFVDEALLLRESSLGATRQSLDLSSADYSTGTGMTTLDDQLSLLNSLGQLSTELDSLQHRRSALRTNFKSALGLLPTDADPAFPAAGLTISALPSEEELWQLALAANPEIATMRAMVEMAVAGVEVAETAGTPDFSLGGMADLKADPLMFRPVATVTLPVWRDRIAATVAAAAARRDAAIARLNSQQLDIAAELAREFHMVRESDRMLAYIDNTLLPNLDRALVSAAAGLQTGMTRAGDIPANRLIALDMKLQRLGVLRQRELAVTDISLMVAAAAPADTPLASSEARQ